MKRVVALLAPVALGVASLGLGSVAVAARAPLPTRTQWRADLARVPRPGRGCFQAAYPKLGWQATPCAVAPTVPLTPVLPGATPTKKRVGDGHDYSATVSGLISQAVGTFTDVSPNITEMGRIYGSGFLRKNTFTLQLNSQFFHGSPACAGSAKPSKCLAWQQYVYETTQDLVYMQYWMLFYNAACPSGWYTYKVNSHTIFCYTNSLAAHVYGGKVTAPDLATTSLTGTATAGGTDSVIVTRGSGLAYMASGPDTVVDLAKFWNTTEWGLFGDANGSEAHFPSYTSLEPVTTLTSTSTSPPTCVLEGFTGETNNLQLAATPALGTVSSPTMGSRQSNGQIGTPDCATAS